MSRHFDMSARLPGVPLKGAWAGIPEYREVSVYATDSSTLRRVEACCGDPAVVVLIVAAAETGNRRIGHTMFRHGAINR
jgi:hypothetical protein